MDVQIKTVAALFRHNDRMLRLALSELNDEDAFRRTRAGTGSSIYWIVGHLLASRLRILIMLGLESENRFQESFGTGTLPAVDADFPEVSQLTEGWNEAAARVHDALADLTPDAALAKQSGHPTPDQTVRGALLFRAWHESYHIGQIGLFLTELEQPPLASRLRADWLAEKQ